MRKRLIPFFLMALIAMMGSCVGDDIDSLQDQIDDLNNKVVDLEKSQQEALLAAIANIQASIAALQVDVEAGDSDLAAQYEALLNNLQVLQEEVTNNKDAVYYGNLLTDADFEAFETQGATIVTGKVIATTQEQVDAVAALKLVGGNLLINGDVNVVLPDLQTISGSLIVESINGEAAAVSMPALASIGDELIVRENDGLTTLSVAALIFVNGNATLSGNMMLADLMLATVTFNGDVYFSNGLAGELTLGQLNGNLDLMETSITKLIVNSSSVNGNFNVNSNNSIESYDLDKITEIKGDLSMSFNGVWGSTNAFATFTGLTTIGGNVSVSNNYVSTMESFNSVTEVKGNFISIQGDSYTLVSVFDKLLYNGTRYTIDLNVRTDWFDGFNELTNANILNVNLEGNESWDETTFEMVTTPNKVNGFAKLLDCKGITLKVTDVFEFDAFNAFDNFWSSYGKYCHIYVPLDTNVDLCSMKPLLDKIAAGTIVTGVEVKFFEDYTELTEPVADIISNRLIDSCN